MALSLSSSSPSSSSLFPGSTMPPPSRYGLGDINSASFTHYFNGNGSTGPQPIKRPSNSVVQAISNANARPLTIDDLDTLSSKNVTAKIVSDDEGNTQLSITDVLPDESNSTTTFNAVLLNFIAMGLEAKKAAAAAAAAAATAAPATAIAAPATAAPATAAPAPAPDTTSSPSLPPPPPQIQVKFEHGLFVPQNGELFDTLTNKTNISGIIFPVWVTAVDILGEWDFSKGVLTIPERTSRTLLRGYNPPVKKIFKHVATVIRFKSESYIIEQQKLVGLQYEIQQPEYGSTRERYTNFDKCKPENPKECMHICQSQSGLRQFINWVKEHFSKFVLDEKKKIEKIKKQTGRGIHSNKYSRQKLNKKKAIKHTHKKYTRRYRRRNVNRKTKKN
jgi:hypothetical protein